MSEEIAKEWLKTAVTTIADKDHAAHMQTISKKVSLEGIEGYEKIGYNEWFEQTKHELEDNIIKSVKYDGFILLSATEKQILFKTFETVEANDGTVNAQAIEALLEKEDDGFWRLIKERVLPREEAKNDGLVKGAFTDSTSTATGSSIFDMLSEQNLLKKKN